MAFDLKFELILESIGQSLAYDAIQNHNVVIINYAGDDDTSRGKRTIEPYVLGRTSANNIAIRAFQPNGDTSSSVPNWKTFRLDRILSWNPTKKTFNSPPNQRGFNVAPYNQNGDGSLQSIRIQAKFDGYNNQDNDIEDKHKSNIEIDRDNLVNKVNNKKDIPTNNTIPNQQDNSKVDLNQPTQNYFYDKGNETNNNISQNSNTNTSNTVSNNTMSALDKNDYSKLNVTKDQLKKNLEDYEKNKQKRLNNINNKDGYKQ